MSTVVMISSDLAEEAKVRRKVERRSLAAQIEYWAVIGKAVEETLFGLKGSAWHMFMCIPFRFIKVEI